MGEHPNSVDNFGWKHVGSPVEMETLIMCLVSYFPHFLTPKGAN